MSAHVVTVLVVDDRPDVRLSLMYMLDASGYAAVEAASGRHAVTVVGQRRIDVVLADISMPEMDGIDLAKALRNRPTTSPKIILMTGSRRLENASDPELLRQLGTDAVLQKPFSREALTQTIARLLQRPRGAES